MSIPVPRTIADGQASGIPGELTFSINRHLVDEIVLVSDDEIREAMRFAFERLKIVIEPSGATPLAALLAGRPERLPPRVGLIVSGGNIDTRRFAELCARLNGAGRRTAMASCAFGRPQATPVMRPTAPRFFTRRMSKTRALATTCP